MTTEEMLRVEEAVAAARADGFTAGIEAAAQCSERRGGFVIAKAIRALVPAAAERDAGGGLVEQIDGILEANSLQGRIDGYTPVERAKIASEIAGTCNAVAQYRAALEPFTRLSVDSRGNWILHNELVERARAVLALLRGAP